MRVTVISMNAGKTFSLPIKMNHVFLQYRELKIDNKERVVLFELVNQNYRKSLLCIANDYVTYIDF